MELYRAKCHNVIINIQYYVYLLYKKKNQCYAEVKLMRLKKKQGYK